MRVSNVIETKAALHTQPVMVGGAITTLRIDDDIVFHLIGDLTANTAIGAK